MKIRKLLFPVVALMMVAQVAQSQVLISLLFGDKLNSPTLKFGLDGGVNFSSISNAGATKYTTGFDLGFYFDFLLKKDKPWYLHTGVIVKSPMGADALPPQTPYNVTSADSIMLDTLFADGGVNRKLRYFNVPILLRYKFKFNLFAEAGVMLGLMSKATDEFYTDVNEKQDLTFQNKVVELYHRIDMGGMAGIGYHFEKGTGTDIGFRYYFGLMDIKKDNNDKAMKNSAFYLYIAIPVGAGEKAKAKQAAAKQKKLEKQQMKLEEEKMEEKK